MHVRVQMFVCINVCVFVYARMFLCVFMCVFVYVGNRVRSGFFHVCICVRFVHVIPRMCVCVCVCVCTFACVRVCACEFFFWQGTRPGGSN